MRTVPPEHRRFRAFKRRGSVSRIVVASALSLLVAGSAGAEVIRPNLRCGAPIPRAEVKGLAVAELLVEKAGAFVL